MARRRLIAVLTLCAASVSLHAQRTGDASKTSAITPQTPPPIQDNSFLIEEAYNQERGVVQHISGLRYDTKGGSAAYQFTQEWPIGGIAHQLSYGIIVARAATGSRTGLGDSRINYRYQLMGDGAARIAVAPRVTAVLPTGDYRQDRGFGAAGVEVWLPVTAVLSEQIVTHWNVGGTFVPHARNSVGDRASVSSWSAGSSAIWLAHPRFNVLVESVFERTTDVSGPDQIERRSAVTLSPGVRWSYNYASGLQIVPGLAVPFGVGPNAAPASVFLYLSFEHPFKR